MKTQKIFLYFFIIIAFIFFINCGKKKNKELAQTYYKMSLLELNDQNTDNTYRKSLDYINKALAQQKRAEYLALKATLLFRLNYEDEGLFYFDEALLCNPDSAVRTEILNNKACLLAENGMKNNDLNKINEALDLWAMLQLDKDYLTPEVAYVNSAKVFFNKKDYKKVNDLLFKAVYLSPGYLDAHYYLACNAYFLEDFFLANKQVQTVLYLEPNHKGAQELANILRNK